jgi:hypothetical protein
VQNSERRASKKKTVTGRAGKPRGPCNELANRGSMMSR